MPGDKEQNSLEAVYLAHAKPLYYYLLKLSGSAYLAEELVQETFYRATLSLDLYEDGQVKSWLFKVARNAYMDEWRRRNRFKWLPFYEVVFDSEEMLSPDGLPEAALLETELRSEIQDGLSLLSERDRSLIYLREYEELSYEELTKVLDVSLDQVKVGLYRARKRLAQLLEKEMKQNG